MSKLALSVFWQPAPQHAVNACVLHHAVSVDSRQYVAVAQHRDLQRMLDGLDMFPICNMLQQGTRK